LLSGVVRVVDGDDVGVAPSGWGATARHRGTRTAVRASVAVLPGTGLATTFVDLLTFSVTFGTCGKTTVRPTLS